MTQILNAKHGHKAGGFEKESLVKSVTAYVAPKLQTVLAHDSAVVIRPLEHVSNLRKLSFKVISYCESARDRNVRQARVAGKSRGNASAWGHCGPARQRAALEAICSGNPGTQRVNGAITA